MPLIHNFHLEHYGDRFSTLDLTSLHHKASLTQYSEEASKMRKIIIQLEPPMLNRDNFNKLLSSIDCVSNGRYREHAMNFRTLEDVSLLTTNEVP